MPDFGLHSAGALASCCDHLQRLFHEVVKGVDCRVLEGHRSNSRQDLLYHQGASTLRAGESLHNQVPSEAVDVVPWFQADPHIRWDDRPAFYRFVGYVEGVAYKLGIKIRVGADWDGDWEWQDQTFHDLPHFECLVCKAERLSSEQSSRRV